MKQPVYTILTTFKVPHCRFKFLLQVAHKTWLENRPNRVDRHLYEICGVFSRCSGILRDVISKLRRSYNILIHLTYDFGALSSRLGKQVKLNKCMSFLE